MEVNIKRLLLTGAGGLLGKRVAAAIAGRYQPVLHFHHPAAGLKPPDCFAGDLSDRDHVRYLTENTDPDIIVNCAALVDVDRCETDPKSSHTINVKAVHSLIEGFPRARFIQVSTDYVFSDDTRRGRVPPSVDDTPNPINVYGRHKLEAETIVLSSAPENLVVRVNTLFDHGTPKNFFEVVCSRLRSGRTVHGLTDQVANPLAAFSTAELLVRLMEKEVGGVYHLGGKEYVSRYQLARAIAEYFQFDARAVVPVESKDYPRPAARPTYGGLDCRVTERLLEESMPGLCDGFARIRDELNRGIS